MKKKLILTVGAPGSGKSTWAEEQAAKSRKGNRTIVLNRDDLRAMMFGGKYKYSRENEALVFDNLLHTLTTALLDNHTNTVIVADTNLNFSTVQKLKAVIDYAAEVNEDEERSFEFEQVPFDVPWVELEARNLVRGNKAVPKPVLRDMYLKMEKYLGRHKQYTPDLSKPKAVIFDLDGTLADNSHRNAFEYWKLPNDKPIEFVVNLAKMYSANGYKIICVSGRNAGQKNNHREYFDLTDAWLANNGVPADALFMREWDDRRKDDVTKEEIFWKHIADNYNVECAFDDRDRVIELWRRIGVNAAQTNFGEF